MLTTLRQRERREGLKLKLMQIPIPPKNLDEITPPLPAASPIARTDSDGAPVNITGQITPVKQSGELARARGVENPSLTARKFIRPV